MGRWVGCWDVLVNMLTVPFERDIVKINREKRTVGNGFICRLFFHRYFGKLNPKGDYVELNAL